MLVWLSYSDIFTWMLVFVSRCDARCWNIEQTMYNWLHVYYTCHMLCKAASITFSWIASNLVEGRLYNLYLSVQNCHQKRKKYVFDHLSTWRRWSKSLFMEDKYPVSYTANYTASSELGSQGISGHSISIGLVLTKYTGFHTSAQKT